ncbi:hypothetical protein ACOBR2_01935 [Telmatobacter bradus]|uniref:hypothetical protein n=1 Tax=Telmatobacter bradus TaxID=474953 RepID=UPI003B435D93
MNQLPRYFLKLVQNMLTLAASAVGCFVFVRGFSLVANGYGESAAISVRGDGAVPKRFSSIRVALFILASATAKAMMLIQPFYR